MPWSINPRELKVGDDVTVFADGEIVEIRQVAKVLKTVVDLTDPFGRFDLRTGERISFGRHSDTYHVLRTTPEHRAEIERNLLILKLNHNRWVDLPLEPLRALVALLPRRNR